MFVYIVIAEPIEWRMKSAIIIKSTTNCLPLVSILAPKLTDNAVKDFGVSFKIVLKVLNTADKSVRLITNSISISKPFCE